MPAMPKSISFTYPFTSSSNYAGYDPILLHNAVVSP